MGFFKSIFGISEPQEEKVLPWQSLTRIDQLDEIEKRSLTKPQIIFKHFMELFIMITIYIIAHQCKNKPEW